MSGSWMMRQGQTDPPVHYQFKNQLGNVVPLPTGTTFQFYIYNPNTFASLMGQGSFIIVDLTNGQVDYNWNSADTINLNGKYQFYVQYTLPTGGVGYSDTTDLIVDPLIVQ